MADYQKSKMKITSKNWMFRIWTFPAFMLSLIIGISACDSDFFGSVQGDVSTNVPPVVSFANVPADQDTFGFAPVIYWKGKDSDGFVEYYEYADIIDSTALNDPLLYQEYIPEAAWIRTETTSDTVFLLTESGQITEHVFYLRCVDNNDASSDIIYRIFYRSNEPPYTPQIKWFLDSDDDFDNDVVLTDTLYVLGNINDTWAGLGFNWKSTDPDDKDLYRIPLEYFYYLEKTPHDTIWQWVSSAWTMDQDVQIFDLETGHYKLTVWVRDDGFERSERPASVVFDVYRPSFERSILVLDCNEVGRLSGFGDVMGTDTLSNEYDKLMEQAALYSSRYQDWERVRCPDDLPSLYKSFIGKFQLIILLSDNSTSPFRGSFDRFEDQLIEYMDIGGKFWAMGSYLGNKGVLDGYLDSRVTARGSEYEFVSAISSVADVPDISIDTTRIRSAYSTLFQDNFPVPILAGIDVMQTFSDAETVYYFNSYTDTASGDIMDELAFVAVSVDTLYYPPTPFNCLITLQNQRVSEVTRVENITRGKFGEVVHITNNVGADNITVVKISYASGEPWAVEDDVRVDYTFLPFSDFHYKPCALRYEELSGSGSGFEIRFRLAIFTFPIYFLDDSEGDVSRMFNSMLDWFFWPSAH